MPTDKELYDEIHLLRKTTKEDIALNDQYIFFEVKRTKHGSAFDRGSADAYYGRPRSPHYWPEGTGHGAMIEEKDMSEEQVFLYNFAYSNETDRKDWT